jgi:hypothetical protein
MIGRCHAAAACTVGCGWCAVVATGSIGCPRHGRIGTRTVDPPPSGQPGGEAAEGIGIASSPTASTSEPTSSERHLGHLLSAACGLMARLLFSRHPSPSAAPASATGSAGPGRQNPSWAHNGQRRPARTKALGSSCPGLRHDLPYRAFGADVNTCTAPVAESLVDRWPASGDPDRPSRAGIQAAPASRTSDFVDTQHRHSLYLLNISRRTPFICRKVAP